MKHLKQVMTFSGLALLLAGCQKEITKSPLQEEISTRSSAMGGNEKLKNHELELNISGLEDLGPNARYEGWVIMEGQPVSTGVFTVNNYGQMSQTVFEVPGPDGKLKDGAAFVLTIEPYPDNSSAPSDQHLMAGNFNENSANLSIGHPAALNTMFASATGQFLLATPTTSDNTDELSGIWFMNPPNAAGLTLPVLPTGWRYEGWAVIDGMPVSTGAFMNGNMTDAAGPFSGPLPGPMFPGEDFIMYAPAGLSFPTDLSGGMAVISVEPYPDNSPKPFLLKPLVRMIPNPATQHSVYNMNLNAGSFPTGTAVTKK